ncbi:MAG: DUF484 family protein [Proteobacteria bacterium]|nr:DUF484 family protein [Pseudomonadota bacterium]MDA0994612.1 DUF484 family protein [Pseudomonadota bacterium]
MSTQRKPDFAGNALSESAIHDYLAANPDFFEKHASLLSTLRLPHVAGGAVSLVERQVSVLRQKDVRLERKLKDLLQVARANEALGNKIHRLTLKMLASADLTATLVSIEQSLRTDFDADHSILVLFGDPESFSDIHVGRFFLSVQRDDDAIKTFDTFLNGSGPRCGQVRDAQRDFLFGKETDEIGSAALVPLGDKAGYGFLAIGSADTDRFHPGMSIDFLTRLGELVTEALKRF